MFLHSYRDLSSIHCDTFHALCREVCEQLLQSHPSIEFRSNTSFAICNHWPSHPGSHSPSNLLYKISIRVILLLCSVLSAFSNSQPTNIASSTTRLPRFAMNCAKSSFPSLFCFCANTSSSNRVFMPFFYGYLRYIINR